MKTTTKKILKYLVPILGIAFVGSSVAIVATSCSNNKNHDSNKTRNGFNHPGANPKDDHSTKPNHKNTKPSSSPKDKNQNHSSPKNDKQKQKLNKDSEHKFDENVNFGPRFNSFNDDQIDNQLISFSSPNYNINVVSNQNPTISLKDQNLLDNKLVSYYISSPELNLDNQLVASGSSTFNIPQTLINYVNRSSENYLSFSLIAKYQDKNQTIVSTPTTITLYKPIQNNNNKAQLFCLPSNTLTKQFNANSNLKIKLISSSSNFENVKQWQVVRVANNINNSKVEIPSTITANNDNANSSLEFSYQVQPGWQEFYIKGIGENNQTIATSNIISLEGVNEMKMNLTSSNLNKGLVQVGSNQNAILDFQTNLKDFSLSSNNIYYQNANTNNQWVSLNDKAPSHFQYTINNNSLQITNFTNNYATNFKVVDPIHQISTNVVTISSYVNPEVFKPNIVINNQTLNQKEIVIPPHTETISLTNTNDYKSSLLTQSWYIVNPLGQWEKIGEGDHVDYHINQMGAYRFKLSLTWKNLVSSPSVNQVFNVNIKNDNEYAITNEQNILNQWTNNSNNIKNSIIQYLKQNPNWLIDYLSTWGYGHKLSINANNITQALSDPKILVDTNKDDQLILKANIKSELEAQQYQGNDTWRFKEGDTLYVRLPFFLKNNKVCSISTNVDQSGYSWLNIQINPMGNGSRNENLAWYVCDANTSKVLHSVVFNMSNFSKSIPTSISINHYQDSSIPQTIENLAPLFNLN